jgi:PAS domain S-box-containing protein
MAAIDRRPLGERALFDAVLRVFSVRAAVELERRRMDLARRHSEESYRSLFEAAEDALFIHDADSGAILDVNPKACAVYGYTPAEFRQLDVGRLSSGVPPYTAEHAAVLMARARSEGRPIYVEWQGRNKDGTLHWDEVYIKHVRLGGAERILAVIRDVTERRQAEADRLRLAGQLRQAQKMEAIGQLTGGIAHDFNNILTGTMGYLGMARERAAAHGDDRLDKYLERAERSGLRARDLIQQMLTFSRGQRGEPRSLQLAPHLAECLSLLKSTLPSSVEIETAFATDLPLVLVDPLHLDQVLMNLCINARDAMQGKGSIRLGLREACRGGETCASCHQPVSGEFVELAVADSGPGIPADVAERMFEPFFSTKEVGKGSGMGLAMVHGIVHDYGGHIGVGSADGEGAEIRILLPAWIQPEPARQAHPRTAVATDAIPATAERLSGRVLLAEDEPSVQEFMTELLSSWGLTVTLSRNGVEACERFAADPEGFGLVLLDQTMPGMTGLEAAAQLTKLRPEIPVILYTGYSEQVSRARLAAAGVRALLRKPVDVGLLRETLGELMGNG